MRNLLEFLHFGKRATKNPTRSDAARSNKPDPASTLIIAGEAVPRSAASAAAASQSATETQTRSAADSKRLVDVVKSRQKDRWHPPELDGPEFGGLIERRGVDTRGLMPQKYEATPVEEHRQAETASGDTDQSHAEAPQDVDCEDRLESTGMFLASLDNSAITLADSGMFKVTDAPEDESEASESFNPYDRRR
jgi:Asp-tRNA(Asn)/Glu-tRNA(Gln) amidotransferase A subunit family amidase